MEKSGEIAALCVVALVGLVTLVFARRAVAWYEGFLSRARPWLSKIAPYDENDGLPLYWPWPKLIRDWGLRVWFFRITGLMCLILVLIVIVSR